MSILSGYISKNVLSATFMVVVALLGLNMVFAIIHELDRISGDYTFWLAIQFVFLELPQRLYAVMPLASMVGCLVGLGALANSSELVVMRSAGLSTLRLVWMALRPALAVMIVAMLIGEYVAPKAQSMATHIKSVALAKQRYLDVNRVVWLRDGNNFVFADVIQPGGVIYGLNIFEFDENDHLLSVKQAKRATYEHKNWLLEDVVETVFGQEQGEIVAAEQQQKELLRWRSGLKPDLLNIAAATPNSLEMHRLWSYSRYLKKQNLNSIEYELAFWEKVFYPLVMVSLVLVGIAFVFGPLREVTMGYRVFTGVLIGVVFNTFQQALGPISIVFGFSPVMAMALPALICGVIGLFLLARVK